MPLSKFLIFFAHLFLINSCLVFATALFGSYQLYLLFVQAKLAKTVGGQKNLITGLLKCLESMLVAHFYMLKPHASAASHWVTTVKKISVV